VTERAVIVTDVRPAFALVSVEVSLTERASRALTVAFAEIALRVEAPAGPVASNGPSTALVLATKAVADRVQDALTRHGFDVRVVAKGAP
jgi:hypothetical protein